MPRSAALFVQRFTPQAESKSRVTTPTLTGMVSLRACARFGRCHLRDNDRMLCIASLLKKFLANRVVLAAAFIFFAVFKQGVADESANNARLGSLPPIERIVPYVDEDYGFTLAIPQHWSRVYAAEDEADADALEPGYAVGFESPRSSESDHFADYLMVEVLPGTQTGAFESDGNEQTVHIVDGRVAVTDTIYLDDFPVGGGTSLDLVVYQAEIIELGFTVTLFAIGEAHEAEVLGDAFELALKTLTVPDDPFSVS